MKCLIAQTTRKLKSGVSLKLKNICILWGH